MRVYGVAAGASLWQLGIYIASLGLGGHHPYT